MQHDDTASAPIMPPAAANPALPVDGASSRLGLVAALVCVSLGYIAPSRVAPHEETS
jgi:hypothetical protein